MFLFGTFERGIGTTFADRFNFCFSRVKLKFSCDFLLHNGFCTLVQGLPVECERASVCEREREELILSKYSQQKIMVSMMKFVQRQLVIGGQIFNQKNACAFEICDAMNDVCVGCM